MSKLFSDIYEEVAMGAVPQYIRDMYDEIFEGFLSDISDLYDDDKSIVTYKLEEIKSKAMRDGNRLSNNIHTNYPIELCEQAFTNSIAKALSNLREGKPND